MKIGIISDTHDNLPLIKKAVDFFNEYKVDFVVHGGDFVAPFSLNPFLDSLLCEWRGVLGNNDGEKVGLIEKSQERITPPPLFLTFNSKRLALTHIYQELEADIVIYGHTHEPKIYKEDSGKLIINPGEACGWLTGKATLAILDLDNFSAEIFNI